MLSDERERATTALNQVDALEHEEVIDLTSWLDDRTPDLWAEFVLELATMSVGVERRDPEVSKELDTVAEALGLRVAVKQDGSLGLQLAIPDHLHVPGEPRGLMTREIEKRTLSPSSS